MDTVPKRISSRSAYKNRYLEVKVDTIEFKGKQWEQAYFVKPNKDSVVVLPLDETGIFLIYQYRYSCQQFLWQLPAGMIDPGNDELQTAKTELEEEAGFTAGTFTKIGKIIAEPGMSPQQAIIYVASSLHKTQTHLSDSEIGMHLKHFTFEEINTMIKKSEIVCGFTLSSILLLKENYKDF